MVARHHRHPSLFHERLGGGLVAHGHDGLRRRTNEDNIGISTGLDKPGVLGEKTIAWMNRLSTRVQGGFDYGVTTEIAFSRRRRPDGDGLAGHGHMTGVSVDLGVDRHGGDTKASRGRHDAARDLAPVGDEYLVEQR